jgi:hypothetical protein
MSQRVADLLLRCGTETAVLPPTELYNEGWLLRLTLDWFERNRSVTHPFAFDPGGHSQESAHEGGQGCGRFRAEDSPG